MDITFGPVPSRRLGRSLGINNIPPKICSYACIYCQLGNTLKMQIERRAFFNPAEIFTSVKLRVQQVIANHERIDYLAFVPDGEPTLDINLGETIERLKELKIPIAVISNASLIVEEDVRADLLKADWVSLKVDAGTEDIWKKIDRPHGKLRFEEIKMGLFAFRNEYKGILATETMLIKGLNDNPKAIDGISEILRQLDPDSAYIAVPTRPPAKKGISAAAPAAVNSAYQIISAVVKKVELLTGYEGNAFSFTGDTRQDILNITSVHPMRKDAVEVFLDKAGSDWEIIDKMLEKGEIIQSEFNGHTFYLRNF